MRSIDPTLERHALIKRTARAEGTREEEKVRAWLGSDGRRPKVYGPWTNGCLDPGVMTVLLGQISCPSEIDQYMVSKRRGRGHANKEYGEIRETNKTGGGVPSRSGKKGYAILL